MALVQDPDQVIEDPRVEAADILDGIKDTMFRKWAKMESDILKVMAGVFNSLLIMRRYFIQCFCH